MKQVNGGSVKQRWGLIALVSALSFASGGWLLGTAATPQMTSEQLFERVMGAVRQYYVDSLPTDSLFHKAAQGLLLGLEDPYSTLLEGDDFKQLTEQTTGNYGGLGIQIDVRDGWITVVAPLPETPAERAGIEAGDQIVALDGKSTQNLNQDEAVKTLRGEAGTTAKIQVRRPGIASLLDFSIKREVIHFRSVQPGTMVGDGIGFVQLRSVSETSTQEMQEEIERLRKAGMRSLILDLRRNPGGLLDQGVAVTDLFLDPGQQIVSTRGRAEGMSRIAADSHNQLWPEMPVVVLVDEFSASAAEIIAGALQDNDRAVLVGTPTFGKGLVQSLFNLGNGSALKLTTARWYTPSGRSIQRTAKTEDEQLRQVENIAAGRDSLATDSLPDHKTVSGRVVKGGGGIVPDRIVRVDTLTDVEKEFVRALGGKIDTYRDALVVTALDIKERKSVTQENFTVTDQMRAAVFTKLAAEGIQFTDEQKAGAQRFVDDQLSYEIARYVFGRQAELRRRALDDRQVGTAVELLRAGTTPRALMSQITGK
jgi:carboxyl-terminal processing protease